MCIKFIKTEFNNVNISTSMYGTKTINYKKKKKGHSNYIKYHAPWNFNSLVCFRVISENIFDFLHVYLGQAEPFIPCVY